MAACLDPETVLELVGGRLSRPRVDEVAAHLDDCDTCRRIVSGMAQSMSPPTVDERGRAHPEDVASADTAIGVDSARTSSPSIATDPAALPLVDPAVYVRLDEFAGTLAYAGFWNMARRYWKMGGYELYRSASKAAFVRSLQKLVPDIQIGDLECGGAGVRAQAVSPDGGLVDDFKISVTPGAVHVVNAPSPAATASLAIGRHVAGLAAEIFGLDAA